MPAGERAAASLLSFNGVKTGNRVRARVSVRLAAARVSVPCACGERACTQGSSRLARGATGSSIGSSAGAASALRSSAIAVPAEAPPASPTTRYSLQLTPPERDHVAQRCVREACSVWVCCACACFADRTSCLCLCLIAAALFAGRIAERISGPLCVVLTRGRRSSLGKGVNPPETEYNIDARVHLHMVSTRCLYK